MIEFANNKNTSIDSTEGCNTQEDLGDCKDWNNMQGMKFNSMK